MSESTIQYQEFVRQVRKYRPSAVIARCGEISAHAQTDKSPPGGGAPNYMSHVLAGIAMASIRFGNEYREAELPLLRFNRLVNSFNNLWDPFHGNSSAGSFFVRTAFEQFPYQENPYLDLARTRALLHTAAAETDQDLITPSLWQEILGCSLDEFFGVALLLHASALNASGRFSLNWIESESFEPISKELSRDLIRDVFNRHFLVSDRDYARFAEEMEIKTAGLERFSPNPILLAPFVQFGDQAPIAPVLKAILFRATPGSIYYTAMRELGDKFSHTLGKVFERYIQSQFQSFEYQLLFADLEYERGKRATDLIIVLPELVLLVEVKATPLTHNARIGGERMLSDYVRAPGKGMVQIETTARLIREGHPGFSEIPRDKKILGLVVTLQPYYVFGSADVLPIESGEVKKWLVCAKDIEQLASIPGKQLGELMLELERSAGDGLEFHEFIRKNEKGKNAILEEEWRAYPFHNSESGDVC